MWKNRDVASGVFLKLSSATFSKTSPLLEAFPAMAFLEGEAHVFPLAWTHLIDSLRKTKIIPAIWLQEMQLLQNKIAFFHRWVSQNYSWGYPTIHVKTKGEKQKKKRLNVWEASLGLYFCHHLFVDAQLLQMSPQATWYKGAFGQER